MSVQVAQPPPGQQAPEASLLAQTGINDVIDLEEDDDELLDEWLSQISAKEYLKWQAMSDEELFADDPEWLEYLKTIKAPQTPYTPTTISESEVAEVAKSMTRDERKEFERLMNQSQSSFDECMASPLMQAVRQYTPDELKGFILPDRLRTDPEWCSHNAVALGRHSRATVLLNQAPPLGYDHQPDNE